MTNTKKLTAAEANRAYFIALANSRGSVSMLSALALPTILILFISNVGPLNPSYLGGYDIFRSISVANQALIGACSAVYLILTVLKRLTYRFQVLTSWVMATMAAIMIYGLCLLTLPMAAYVRDKHLFVTLFGTFALVAVLLLASATAVHAVLLRRRLKVGHSEKRTAGNYLAVSASNRSKMFWIIFGVIAVVPNVVTQGQYIPNLIGICGLILFGCLTTSLPVEFAYLAYLKSKDRDYWERPPRPVAKDVRRRLGRKIILWVLGVSVALAAFWVLAKYVL